MEELFNKLNAKFIAYNWNKTMPTAKQDVLAKIKSEILELLSIPIEPPVKPACERKLIISIENDTVLFDNLNDFKPLEFMGILHNAISTADVLYKTKIMQMVEKASKSD